MGIKLQWSAWPRTIARLKKLRTRWSIPPALMLIYSTIDAISNIEFVVELFRKIELIPAWNTVTAFITSGIGNLVFALTGTAWLGYLIVRPERSQPFVSEERREAPLRKIKSSKDEQSAKAILDLIEKARDPFQSSIKLRYGLGPDCESIYYVPENTTYRPIEDCAYSIENLEQWSPQRGEFIKNKPFLPLSIKGPKILNPLASKSAGETIVTRRGDYIFMEGRSGFVEEVDGTREQVGMPITSDSIWRLTIHVESENGSMGTSLCFRCEGGRELAIIRDPKIFKPLP